MELEKSNSNTSKISSYQNLELDNKTTKYSSELTPSKRIEKLFELTLSPIDTSIKPDSSIKNPTTRILDLLHKQIKKDPYNIDTYYNQFIKNLFQITHK